MTEPENKYVAIKSSDGSATVGRLLEYLKANFRPDDKICYMDCVEGLKNDCTYVTKDMLGRRFFYRVADLKLDRIARGMSAREIDEMYEYVRDDDVVVC